MCREETRAPVLSAGSSGILPSPFLESDGMLDGSIDRIHRIFVCTLCCDPATQEMSSEALSDPRVGRP
ncbi:MAG: hypothetical protein EOS36_26745 [Mesorhizobium sp.]|nr:MAG: hypothetical protein EOS36_26745 [Mesorhizobium sp.]RWE50652.1 MAG: hypothetical protein EOS79_04130 [Mesorhizobium sp.]